MCVVCMCVYVCVCARVYMSVCVCIIIALDKMRQDEVCLLKSMHVR